MRGVGGALGLADNIVTLRDQAALPNTERVIVVRVRPTVVVPGPWTGPTGEVYTAPFVFGIDHCGLDVVAVYTKGLPRDGLTRVESVAAVGSTSNSFFYDLGEAVPANLTRWDAAAFKLPVNRKRASLPNAWRQPSDPLSDIGLEWDSGDEFDGQPTLYVNLGGLVPSDELLAVAVEFVFGTRGMVQASVGPDKITPSGRFETWAAGSPAGWACTGNVRQGSEAYEGSSSLELYVATAATFLQARARYGGGTPTEPGCVYKVSGYYQTLSGNPESVSAAIAVLDGNGGPNYFARDGRHLLTSGSGLALTSTGGAWRHFSMDFLAVNTFTGLDFMCFDGQLLNAGGVVRFDAIAVRRVWRYTRALGRIVGDITASSGMESRGFGGKSVGVTSVTLSNEDGALDVAFRALKWVGAQFALEMMGRFGGDAPTQAEQHRRLAAGPGGAPRPINTTATPGSPLSDGRTLATGYINEPRRSDAALGLSGEDLRTLIYGKRATPNKYASDTFPNADQRIFEQGRPVVMGQVTEHAPNRIDKTTEECGVYEVADCTTAEGIKDITSVALYADSDAASRRDETLRLELLDVGGVITKALSDGQFTAETALVPLVLDTEHEYFSVMVGGVQYDARIMAGTEQFELLTADANGTFGNVNLGGAPTIWQCVEAGLDGKYVVTNNSVAICRVSVNTTNVPSATSIPHVELKVLMNRYQADPGEGDDATAKLFLYKGGTQYYGDTLTFVDSTSREYAYRWELDPSTGSPWADAAAVDACEWGVEWNPGTSTHGLFIDRIRPVARVFLASPPSASNPGICIPLTLAQRLEAELTRLVGAGFFGVFYDDTTRKILIQYNGTPGQVVKLLTSTGKQKSGWGWIGYSTTADASQTVDIFSTTLNFPADNVIYTPDADIDKGQLLCAVSGYQDDALGTYTGLPSGLIERPPDVLWYALVRLFAFPDALVDRTTFEAARTTVTAPLAMAFADERTVKDFVDSIEQAALADVVFVPASVSSLAAVQVEFRPFVFGAVGGEPEVLDGEWLSFESGGSRSKLYGQVDVTFLRSLLLKGVRTSVNDLVKILNKQDAPLSIETDLRLSADAQACADGQATLYAGRLELQGEARGKLLLLTAGDKFLVTRRRGGYLRAAYRAMSLSHNLRSGVTQVTAIEADEAT